MHINPTLLYAIAIIPGFGHLTLNIRTKGYLFLVLGLVQFASVYLAALMFTDQSLEIRLWTSILLLVAPFYLWIYSDLTTEIQALHSQSGKNRIDI